MSKRRFVGVLMGTAALVVACTGGGGSGGSGDGASSGGPVGSIDAFIAQYCEIFRPCCAEVNKPYDEAKCRAFFTALTAGATYDPAKGQACLDAVRGEATGTAHCGGELSEATETTCEGVFASGPSTGTKQPGEACESDSECASSPEGEAHCATSFAEGTTTRRCQVLLHGKEGDECVGEMTEDGASVSSISEGPPPERVAVCYTSEGLFCDSKTKKCAKIQDVGGACDPFSHASCVDSAYCDTTTSTCVARKGAGQDCTGRFGECGDDHYCDAETKKCTAYVAAGQPCTNNDQCKSGSCTNGKCSGGASLIIAFVCAQ